MSLHPAVFSGQSEGWAAKHVLEGFDRLGDVHPAPGRERAAVGLAGWLAIGALGPLGVAWRGGRGFQNWRGRSSWWKMTWWCSKPRRLLRVMPHVWQTAGHAGQIRIINHGNCRNGL